MSRRFVGNVNLIFFTQMINRLLAFVISVAIARGLGPEARGDYALFVLSVTIAASLGAMGAGLGSTYLAGKGKHEVRVLLGNSHFILLTVSTLLTAALLAFGLAYEPKAFVEGKSYWLYALAVPAMLEYILVTAILIGNERFLALNISAVGQAAILTAGVIVLWASGEITIFSTLALFAISYVAASLMALVAVGLENLSARSSLRPDLLVLGEQVGVGFPGQAGNILQRLNYRLDQYVVRAYRSRADVGYYAVAVGLAEAVWWIANAVAMAVLPRLTRMRTERAAEVTALLCRNTLVASIVASLGLAATAPFLVEPLFGNDFGPAVRPILWLLPGVVALSGAKVIGSYFFSQARLGLVSITALISLVVTIALDLLLIPEFGISGAAAASSIAYSVSFVASLYFYQRMSGHSFLNCLLPRPSDVELYVNLARKIRRPRTPADAAGAQEVG